jgi:UDP-2,3-diacylglucosamine pyrophosphatase LpxH
LIADAHVSRRRGSLDAFFRMLEVMAQGGGEVVFLGDIFDLWIALPRYENEHHGRFLAWCREERHRRRIGFVEGNHEFFVVQRHAPSFSWCTHQTWWQDDEGRLFCHGDRINRADRFYLTFRSATKNSLARLILRSLPLGPQLAVRVKHGMKHTNQAFRKTMPMNDLRAFAEARFKEGTRRIFMGHFHQTLHLEGLQGGRLDILPDWCSQGWVSVLHPDETLQQGPWEDLLPLAPDHHQADLRAVQTGLDAG